MAENYVRSPRQATTVFGLDTNSVPRKRSLFYIRFRRSDNGQSTKGGWQDNLGFMVKSVDRPSVQPQIEELNQYGKKRQITTGFKNQNLRCVLYDTADSMAMRMWNEYARWYFGDYRQDDESSWRYDVTLPETLDNGQGFGYTPKNMGDQALDLNSQFFFDAIEVYQVWGGQFTQFDLINPKITAFDPDEFDYSVVEPSTINITLNYEAILHRFGGGSQPISSNERLSAVFNTTFNGGTFDIGSTSPRHGFVNSSISPERTPAVPLPAQKTLAQTVAGALTSRSSSSGGGALSMFGNFNFGAVTKAAGINTGSLAGDVSYLATGNPALATILNLPASGVVSTVENAILSGNGAGFKTVISGSTLDNAQNSLMSAASKVGTKYVKEFVTKNLLGGVTATSMINGNAPSDNFSSDDGLYLDDLTLGVVNANRGNTSQFGINQSAASTLSTTEGNSTGYLPPATFV